MSGYGEVVRETAAERYERKVAAIEAVLREWPAMPVNPKILRKLAEECLAAAETGI